MTAWPRPHRKSIFKFADDTTVVGLITNNDETPYRKEVGALVEWCQEDNLLLNVNKTWTSGDSRGSTPLSTSTGPQWRR
jgi:hypothetical protein